MRAIGGFLVGIATMLSLSSCVVSELGGAFDHDPADIDRLSPEAQALVDQAFAEFLPTDANPAPRELIDFHTHVVGVGSSGSGAYVHSDLESSWNPVRRVKYGVFMSACCVHDLGQGDEQYMGRLHALIDGIGPDDRRPWGRHCIFAFDQNYRLDGTVDLDRTEFYTPNDYVFELAAEHPDRFIPVMSVHPYRSDAIEALERWAARGGRICKWLPNVMGIDPSHPRCEPFYDKMRELGVALISHAGTESAVRSGQQELGNPLLLRAALDRGVQVFVAHCGSLGQGIDFDSPDQERVPNFDLFLRLMDEPRYEGLVFGEISAITQVNRVGSKGRPLLTLLARADLHPRLVNGSDYPIPAVNCVIWTRRLVKYGFLTDEERTLLNEIYEYNPLLFDFVSKRLLRHPESGQRFPPEMFTIPANWEW